MPNEFGDQATKETDQKGVHIRIDRVEYEVPAEKLTGAELRDVPSTPIPADRDLFQVVPGHPDLKIKDHETVQLHDGIRFFTAPNTINPGMRRPRCAAK